MIKGKFNVLIDLQHGSSGKGKISSYLFDKYKITNVSSSNYPNAGHSIVIGEQKFVAKAIPTAAFLNKVNSHPVKCWISPGSGFSWEQLIKEWKECGRPEINIHGRASIVTLDHKKRESEGLESTKHIASTMQGTAAAIVDKILRKADCLLAGNSSIDKWVQFLCASDPVISDLFSSDDIIKEFIEKVHILDSSSFRQASQDLVFNKETWLHEGSQGYALSIDHGSHYPNCTSRNCSMQAIMDYMAMPPSVIGDVYGNLRTFGIRVGNVVDENGVQHGYSGDFYPDSKELTWNEIGTQAGMPSEEISKLAEIERTTVTRRIRRCATFSYIGLKDAVRTNGITKLSLNFIQYINWKDRGLSGGREAFNKLSTESRKFISKVEETVNVPITLIGTGPSHDEIIDIT